MCCRSVLFSATLYRIVRAPDKVGVLRILDLEKSFCVSQRKHVGTLH